MVTPKHFLLVAAAALTTVALAQAVSKSVLHSSIFDWDSLKTEPKPTGSRRAVFDSRTATMDQLECHVTTLLPGQAPHASHRHPEEELIILKEGTLEVVQNGVTNQAHAGAVIFQASNEIHGFRNTGPTASTYYVVKFVPPGLSTNRTAVTSSK
jgi:XRE family transcriptional regulator, regulator of sulfur utilization